jgi:hypothetical protein
MDHQTSRRFLRGDEIGHSRRAEYFTRSSFDAGSFRREDLSEEAWRNRNENIRHSPFGKRATNRCRRQTRNR